MEKTTIIDHISKYVKELSSETRLGTYSIPRMGRKALLQEGSGKTTRGNTPWKVAQYVIATTTSDDEADISSIMSQYLETWKSLMSGYGNQFLIIEVKPGEWQMYDWDANLIGDNDVISKFVPEVYKVTPISQNSNTNEINYAILRNLKDSYNLQELADELHRMNDSLGTSGIHLFGLKFGKFLTKDINLKELCLLADVSENYHVELNKMRNVYKNISDHEFGVCFYEDFKFELPKAVSKSDNNIKSQFNYLRAMRTKPFLLLAGISGTGKSRIVKQMAFDSCPDKAILRKDPTSPGNYCLVEVKPNWHDSTELLGYESKIGGDHYQLTPFIKFLAKAMLHPEAPFFVCLDEMNLAPVEQYFAEFLSVLESRTKIDCHIVSEPLIKADIFKKYSLVNQLFSINKDNTSNEAANSTSDPSPNYGKEYEVYELLKKDGLRIPENVVIIGTVNMDETTHQFSRKVIDRAMTIEMNLPEGNPFMDFFSNSSELTYRKQPTHASLYLATETKASDVVNALASVDVGKTEWLKGEIASFLTELNNALDGTPFKVAYRVQNELMLYFHQLWLEDQTAHWRDILNTACDQILMMKVLPRIEGDSELLEKPLTKLISFCAPYTNASKKLDEMNVRLDKSQFTSFWP